jgi:hypothetical protein
LNRKLHPNKELRNKENLVHIFDFDTTICPWVELEDQTKRGKSSKYQAPYTKNSAWDHEYKSFYRRLSNPDFARHQNFYIQTPIFVPALKFQYRNAQDCETASPG